MKSQSIYCGDIFDYDQAKSKIAQLAIECDAPDLWSDPKKAQSLLKEKNYLTNFIAAIDKLESELKSYLELIALGEEAKDDSIVKEAYNKFIELAEFAKNQEIECMFSGEADTNDCFLEINCGAGGTESHDWADMLFRAYTRWAEKHGFKLELVYKLDGEEAGIKSASLKVIGHNAYGWLKTESGVHRLVRISPFNAAGKRHTSFASVWVYPVVDDSIEIIINESELRIDTYRASGAGGQHVNTTDSAVRITHIPTNIVVQCQSGRSQHKNKEEAFKMLRSRLYEVELQKRMEAVQDRNATKTSNSWGNQIRSYVLQPYQMVKDLRTGYEETDTQGVLDGKFDGFMKAMLKSMVSGQGMK